MTRQEFQSKETNMAELATLLRGPILRAAIEVVKGEGVGFIPQPIPAVDYQAQVAVSGAHMVGWMRAVRALETLTIKNAPIGIMPFKEAQFEDAALRRMREAGLYSEEEIRKIKP